MLFLLSPAKTLDYETPAHVAAHTKPLFAKQAAELIGVLRLVVHFAPAVQGERRRGLLLHDSAGRQDTLPLRGRVWKRGLGRKQGRLGTARGGGQVKDRD